MEGQSDAKVTESSDLNKNKVSPKKVVSPAKEPVSRIVPNKNRSLLLAPITTGRTRKQEEEKRIRFVKIIFLNPGKRFRDIFGHPLVNKLLKVFRLKEPELTRN